MKILLVIGKVVIVKSIVFFIKFMSEKFIGLFMFVLLFGIVKVLYLESMILSKNLIF